MATQLLTRKQRGEQIAPEDIVELNPTSYFVKSQSGKSGYAVKRVGQHWACDCFDHKFRSIKCKHIHAVEARISEHSTDPAWPYSLGLWEAPK